MVATSIHVKDAQANGLLWTDNTAGDNKGALQNFRTPDVNSFTGFAKSNGLGDLDAFTGLAPVQIGNRLWYDTNRNGIQDADEEPVTDTVVELVDCDGNVVDTTRTDSEGEYVFAIEAGTCYAVRVPLDQPSLDGWVPTQPFAGDNRRIDSNGIVRDGRSVALVTPKGTGRNNHSYDFGFHRPLPPEPPTPEPPPPDREQPPEPGVVDQDGPLVLAKHVVRKSRSRSSTRLSSATADHAASTACACATGCPLGSLTSARQGRAAGSPAAGCVGASRRCRVGSSESWT